MVNYHDIYYHDSLTNNVISRSERLGKSTLLWRLNGGLVDE